MKNEIQLRRDSSSKLLSLTKIVQLTSLKLDLGCLISEFAALTAPHGHFVFVFAG